MKNKVNIAIVGFGNIGSYFYKTLLKRKKNISIKTGKVPIIKYICAKNINKKRLVKIPRSKWIKNPLKIPFLKDVDVIVELIGGSDGIAKKLVYSALKNRKHVITANKALMAKHGDQLAIIAEKNKVNLEYEASVAGGIPIIRAIKEGLITNKINKIYGILNGTTNYILSKMESSGHDFYHVLNNAKKLGFAESNPISDLNGNDSADKLRILSSIAFSINISKNKILTEGIQNINLTDILYAKKFGYKIKLLSISENKKNKLIERVHPCLVSGNSFLANTDGVLNAIVIDAAPVGKTVLQGEGAGPGPTSSALISDLCSVLRGNIKYPFGIPEVKRKKISVYKVDNYTNSLYLRFEVKDRPGVLSQITQKLANNKISVERLIQIPDHKKKTASIVIITHKSKEINAQKCLKSFRSNKNILKSPTLIRLL